MLQRKKWDVDFLGVHPSNEEIFELIGRHKSAFVNKQNTLQFYIKLINEPPDSFPRNQILFTCYPSDIEKYGFQEDYSQNEYTRVNELSEFLVDSLVLFKPTKKVLTNREEHFYATNIRLIPKLESYKPTQTFKSIPIFSTNQQDMTREEFVESLIQGKYVGTAEGISIEPYDTPTIVLWREGNVFTAFGLFDKHEYAHGGFSFVANDGVKEISFNPWINKTYREGNDDDALLFLDQDSYNEIEGKLKSVDPDVHILREAFQPSSYNDEVSKNENEDSNETSQLDEDGYVKEEEFMDHFINVTRDNGLQYKEADLYNFHTAMKSNALTILAGMSGTGKSKLVQAYGKALGLDANQLLFIPVRPSWTDDSDLLGYVDTKNMLYRPSDTSIVDTLFIAQQDRTKMFIVCFDEMNLSRVEHYFSQFLSVLEMDSNRRTLRLYSDRIAQQIYNSGQYGPEVNIGPNVVFVGTVNLDESTYHFSDKVLDRANVISLEVSEYSKLKNKNSREAKEKTRRPYTYEQYSKFKKQESTLSLSDDELELLWAIHETMQKESRNLGIGPRVIKQIDQYLKNLPNNSYLGREEAFDIQVVQRILTKLRGPEGLLKGLVGKINEDKVDGKIYEVIEKYSRVSKFTKTIDVLYQKAKELKVNGFTL
ncbi:McrB family protein [Paenibacillus sacheonensis]|uniref:AAA domain-containing protein n=1 Tax=Paenibacillus sacheonensis TaxID=742054 RepID=A0A7X4YQZ8_9BACL|nr:AAA family ATPase [Paenibacillus sacheonensis]MBM7565257.1 MoxR-like ATPase [Paenibacillus sacheonensis]NBC69969.1 AAA domain-containing protein [Paenibacillus sacheonensis]